MPIKRTAPVSLQQELQISDQLVYRFKPSPESQPVLPPTKTRPPIIKNYVVADLLKTALTSAFIIAIVLVVMWRGWLK